MNRRSESCPRADYTGRVPDLYDAAYYFGRRLNSRYVVGIGVGNAEKLRWLGSFFQVVVVNSADQLSRFTSAVGQGPVNTGASPSRPLLGPLFDDRPPPVNASAPILVEGDIAHSLPVVPRSILSDAIVICADASPFLRRPKLLLRQLADLSRECRLLVLASDVDLRGETQELHDDKAARQNGIAELDQLLRSHGIAPFVIGLTMDRGGKNALIAISGTLAAPPVPPQLVRVLAIIHVFNEQDILKAAVSHLLSQGVDVTIVNNWSSDGSYEIAHSLAERDARVSVERFPPEGPSEYFDLKQITANVELIARRSNYDWIIHHDTDEIRESPWPELTLQQAVSAVDGLGFNAVDFTVLEFKLTEDGFTVGVDPARFFTHCQLRDSRVTSFKSRPGRMWGRSISRVQWATTQ